MNEEMREEYREEGRQLADDLYAAAGRGVSVEELVDILDASGFDGDICDFL